MDHFGPFREQCFGCGTLSKYLWTDMNVVSRNPAAATRRIKEMGLGRRLPVGHSYGPLEAVFVGQPAEPDDGHFLGIFAEEGIDATSEITETIHVGVHLSESLV